MGRTPIRRTFRTQDGRELLLRHLASDDLPAILKFANGMVEEKKVNRDLGLVAFDRRATARAERAFLSSIVSGRNRGEVVSVAAFHGGKMVGHCDVRRRMADDVMHAGTLGVTILKGYRGVGLGERLLGEALGEARRAGIWLVQLTVFSGNLRAIGLYEKMGFRQAGLIPNKMLRDGRHLDEVIMYADLRGTDKSTQTSRRKS